MIEIVKIASADDLLFSKMWEVYQYSFPQHEKRTKESQVESLERGGEIACFCEDGEFLGFMIYWMFDTFIYIEHLAIEKGVRSRGYGSKLLELFIAENSDRTVVLDIDPPIDEISIRREGFYERLGFVKNNYKHLHPPYNDPQGERFELKLMSHGRELDSDEFLIFKDKLYSKIVTY